MIDLGRELWNLRKRFHEGQRRSPIGHLLLQCKGPCRPWAVRLLSFGDGRSLPKGTGFASDRHLFNEWLF
jgi:hypothetical protein